MQVTRLRHHEAVRLNADRMTAICRDQGTDAGEVAICKAMEDIAVMLAQADAAWRRGERTHLRRHATSVTVAAAELGMPDLVRVAQDICGICCRYDDAALAAVVARLGRLGEGSLLAVLEAEPQFE
ncbi:MAG: hypothetical protein QNJ44_04155 [Rhodobacter sp.]|nr:hypothetical protein [Rhodobacter sp.]